MTLGTLVQALVALLLLASGALVLTGAIGMLRMHSFFERLHASSLIATLGSGCAALASMLYFSLLRDTLMLYQLVILALLAITVPVSTLLLMRATLFRKRGAGEPVPRALDERPLSGK